MKSCIWVFLTFLLILPMTVSAADESAKFVLTNPSFEVADKNGGPLNWGGSRKYFSISNDSPRTGNACLKWRCNDGTYSLCGRNTGLVAGDIVEFSVWVKTQDVRNGSATICMEWMKKNGQWGGGSYAHGVTGTEKNWTRVSNRAIVPEEAASVSITCYVTKGGTGTAWFDDVEIRKFVPPLFTAMTTDLYRHQSSGGPVTVYVGYTQTDKRIDFKKLRPELELLDSQGKSVQKYQCQESGSDNFQFRFDSKSLACGKYRLVCSMTNPGDGKLETISIPFTRLDQFPNRVSYIDQHRRLIHNGTPFFPLGLYMGGAQHKDVVLIGDSPFNCIMPYSPIKKDAMDDLHRHGLKVIYSVKDNFPGLRVKTMEEGNRLTEQMVGEMKSHPAVLAWYINDELPATMTKDLSARRDQMERLDPGRPTWVVLYQVSELRYYLSTFDVLGTDPYPIPSAASRAADWTRKTVDASFGCRAVWQVPQIFNWASYKKTEQEKKEYRAPTYAEMRGMAWMCIANGANGLIFYSFYDLYKMDKTLKQGGQALVREPFDVRWKEVKTMGQEIKEQFPILLSVGNTLSVKAAASSNPEVIHRLYGTEQGTWILAVNTSNEAKTAVFTLPKGSEMRESKLGGAVKADGANVSVSLDALEPTLILVR